MGPYEQLRDRLADGSQNFEWLDAAQLVKHAFGLATETPRRRIDPVLVYLYAEPDAWPDGKAISPEDQQGHVLEISEFGRDEPRRK